MNFLKVKSHLWTECKLMLSCDLCFSNVSLCELWKETGGFYNQIILIFRDFLYLWVQRRLAGKDLLSLSNIRLPSDEKADSYWGNQQVWTCKSKKKSISSAKNKDTKTRHLSKWLCVHVNACWIHSFIFNIILQTKCWNPYGLLCILSSKFLVLYFGCQYSTSFIQSLAIDVILM